MNNYVGRCWDWVKEMKKMDKINHLGAYYQPKRSQIIKIKKRGKIK